MTTLDAAVPLAGSGELGADKARADRTAGGALGVVGSFTQSRARVTIGHLGDLERLKAAVGRAGLALTEETDGWQLRPAGARGAVGLTRRFGRYALSVLGANVANVLTVARLCSAVPIVLLVQPATFPGGAGCSWWRRSPTGSTATSPSASAG